MENDIIDVLGLGAIAVDFLGTVDSWPGKGVKRRLESFCISDGGLIGTALAAVARLGGRACIAGKLGHSEMSNRAVEALKKEGTDSSFIIRCEKAEPVISFVITDTSCGDRNIFWSKNGVQYPYPSEFPDKHWYSRVKVLLIDSESGQAGIEAAGIARLHNVPVIIDAEENYPHIPEALAIVSHIVVSEDFAAEYTQKSDIIEMLKNLRSSASQTVIVTRGKNGCVVLVDEDIFTLSAFKVNVVDTTGCGDVFHGAYALAIARQQSVLEAARFASAAAALCATKLGGRDGIPNYNEVKTFMASSCDIQITKISNRRVH